MKSFLLEALKYAEMRFDETRATYPRDIFESAALNEKKAMFAKAREELRNL